LVQLLLERAHAEVQLGLLLGQERVLDVELETAQEEGLEYLVELLHHVLLVVLLGKREPRVKVLGRAKDIGQQKVEQGPEFVQVVLERRASDEETVFAGNNVVLQ